VARYTRGIPEKGSVKTNENCGFKSGLEERNIKARVFRSSNIYRSVHNGREGRLVEGIDRF
jgi:hypothetical protein